MLRKFVYPMALRHRLATLAGALCAVNACATAHREGPSIQDRRWHGYLGGPTRTGQTSDTVAAEPQPAWRVRVGRGLVGAPAIGETVLAFALSDRTVVLVDRATGDQYWSRRLDQAPGAGPLLADDRLVIAEQGVGGRVRALRLHDGGQIWSQPAGDVAAPAVIAGGMVYAASVEGFVSQFALDNGVVGWRTRVSGAVRATPVAVAGTLLVATAADTLYSLADSSGAVIRRRPTAGTVLAAPALADSTLVIGTADGRLEALDATSLRLRWGLDLGAPIVGSVAIRRGTAYALTSRGEIVAVPLLGPASAARRAEVGLEVRAGPMPTPGGIYVCGVNGEVVRLDQDLVRRWSVRVEPPLAEPALVDGRSLLVVGQHGDVAVFR